MMTEGLRSIRRRRGRPAKVRVPLAPEPLERRALLTIAMTPVPIRVDAGVTSNVVVATFTDSSPVAEGVYGVTIDWGDGTRSGTNVGINFHEEAGVQQVSPGTFEVVAPYKLYAAAGDYPVTVAVQSPAGSVSIAETATVVTAPSAVVTATSFTAGWPIYMQDIGVFNSPALDAVSGKLSATIDWGNGATTAAGLYQAAPGDPIVVGSTDFPTPSYTYPSAGTYTVTIHLSGPDGFSEQAQGRVVVAPEPVALGADPIVVAPGQSLNNQQIGSFNDPYAADESKDAVTINWGDGSAPTAGTVWVPPAVPGLTGMMAQIMGSHTYAALGNYTLTLTLKAGDGSTEVATSSVIVTSDPPGPATLGVAGISGESLDATLRPAASIASSAGSTATGAILATFEGHQSKYTAAVKWGDGSAPVFAKVVPIGRANGTGIPLYEVVASHTYLTPGDYAPQINVIGAGGGSAWASTTAKVATGPLNIERVYPTGATRGVSTSAGLADFQFERPGPTSFTAAVEWGDGSAPVFARVVADPSRVDAGGSASYETFTVEGTHAYAAAGSYRVVINVIAPDGESSWASTTATVVPGDLSISAAPALSGVRGTPLANVDLAHFQFQSDGTLPPTSGFTAAVEWGDGSAPTFVAIEPDPSPPTQAVPMSGSDYEILGSHTFRSPGTYTLLIHVISASGASAWDSTRVTIAGAATTVNG